ncbi:hypothetical protein K458DRAFT_394691 [Lentithecium fluviatile CBS 122367]|uniref:Uncharacterized protein n=1 Tax=Lentithecium fluviatile CBS 122367 TaxID=1168545 RepID=A0A6G1IKX4_9PLEO|nr:hypothetical protein K458DRAFT_394691 [Lentithecium fluviatile CBS 122367]
MARDSSRPTFAGRRARRMPFSRTDRINTCCIDKWDRRERSKAINSMFRWYKDAARCYVFLPDVSAAADAP